MVLVEKKDGHCEKFDEDKSFGNICRACLNARLESKECTDISKKVLRDLKKLLKGRKKISSQKLFREKIKILRKYSKEVAYLYEHHRDIN